MYAWQLLGTCHGSTPCPSVIEVPALFKFLLASCTCCNHATAFIAGAGVFAFPSPLPSPPSRSFSLQQSHVMVANAAQHVTHISDVLHILCLPNQ